MQGTYRGIQYQKDLSATQPAVGEATGKYRGAVWSRNADSNNASRAHADLTYRGISYHA